MPTLNSQLSEVVEQILRADSDAELQESTQELCTLGVSSPQGWMPRGSFDSPSECRLSAQQEADLLLRWKELSGESQHPLTAALSMWGGRESARAFRGEIERSTDPISRAHCVHALGILGGRDAVTGLTVGMVTGDESLACSADWNLKELSTGGSEDATKGIAIVSADYARDVFAQTDWEIVFGAMKGLPEHIAKENISRFTQQIAKRTSTKTQFAELATEYDWPYWATEAIIWTEDAVYAMSCLLSKPEMAEHKNFEDSLEQFCRRVDRAVQSGEEKRQKTEELDRLVKTSYPACSAMLQLGLAQLWKDFEWLPRPDNSSAMIAFTTDIAALAQLGQNMQAVGDKHAEMATTRYGQVCREAKLSPSLKTYILQRNKEKQRKVKRRTWWSSGPWSTIRKLWLGKQSIPRHQKHLVPDRRPKSPPVNKETIQRYQKQFADYSLLQECSQHFR